MHAGSPTGSYQRLSQTLPCSLVSAQSLLPGSDLLFSWSRWCYQVSLGLISTAGSFLLRHFPLVTKLYQAAWLSAGEGCAAQLWFGLSPCQSRASGNLAWPLGCSTAQEAGKFVFPQDQQKTRGSSCLFPKLPETDAVLENSWVWQISSLRQKAIWSGYDLPAVFRTQLAGFMDTHISFRTRNQRCFCLHV